MVTNIQQSDLSTRLASLRGYKSKIAGSSLNSGYKPIERNDGPNKANHSVHDEMTHDMILPSDSSTKLKISVEQTSKLPEYVVRGLKGDTNSSFFEFLKISKIPYYIGGPVLGWCFAAGGQKAKPMAKQIGVGVALYYAAAALAEKLIKMPVKLAKGIDISQPYRKIVATNDTTANGTPKKKVEYHNVYESADFTRWDLMYNTDKKSLTNHRLINKTFDKFAKKMGVKENVNDSDTLTRGEIKKAVIKSRAWTYAMALPLGVAAIGIGSQKPWEKLGVDEAKSINNRIKNAFTTEVKSYKSQLEKAKDKVTRLTARAEKVGQEITEQKIAKVKYPSKLTTALNITKKLGKVVDNAVIEKFVKSTKLFWKTTAGKASIIGAGVVLAMANISLLSTNVRKKDVIDYNNFPSTLREKAFKGVKND